jgi:hypothetical protein
MSCPTQRVERVDSDARRGLGKARQGAERLAFAVVRSQLSKTIGCYGFSYGPI